VAEISTTLTRICRRRFVLFRRLLDLGQSYAVGLLPELTEALQRPDDPPIDVQIDGSGRCVGDPQNVASLRLELFVAWGFPAFQPFGRRGRLAHWRHFSFAVKDGVSPLTFCDASGEGP
jgi:hypothetical protein